MSVIINDNSGDAFEEIRGRSNATLVDFVETAVEHAKDNVHRRTGNLADNIRSDNPEEGHVRLFTETGYGYHEEVTNEERDPGGDHAFIAPAVHLTIDEFQEDGKWR